MYLPLSAMLALPVAVLAAWPALLALSIAIWLRMLFIRSAAKAFHKAHVALLLATLTLIGYLAYLAWLASQFINSFLSGLGIVVFLVAILPILANLFGLILTWHAIHTAGRPFRSFDIAQEFQQSIQSTDKPDVP